MKRGRQKEGIIKTENTRKAVKKIREKTTNKNNRRRKRSAMKKVLKGKRRRVKSRRKKQEMSNCCHCACMRYIESKTKIKARERIGEREDIRIMIAAVLK